MSRHSLPIGEIKVGPRHRRDLGDIDELAENIRQIGLLHPIVVDSRNVLIAGHRRLHALKKLEWTDAPVRVIDIGKVVRGEYAENTFRKAFTPSEEVAVWRAVRDYEAEEAKKRQASAGPTEGRGKKATGSGKLPKAVHGRARDKAARVGRSGRTVEKAEAVVAAAEAEPELFGPLKEKMDRTGRVNGVYRKLRVIQASRHLEQEPPPLPSGPFRVIVVDPPWHYSKRIDDPGHRASLPYPSMQLDEIAGLPIAGMAHQDCILWLWTTNVHIEHAFGIVKAWGFEYKTILTWGKDKMRTGDWLRGKTEHCLMAVRGRPTVNLTNQTTLLQAPARQHSRKPDEFYAMVEALCPGSKVDLFGGEEREGWTVHGNKTDRFFQND